MRFQKDRVKYEAKEIIDLKDCQDTFLAGACVRAFVFENFERFFFQSSSVAHLEIEQQESLDELHRHQQQQQQQQQHR